MRQCGFTIVHLTAVIFLFIVGLTFVTLSVHRMNYGGNANRPKCQSNLSQMGKALLLYSNENKGAFPQTHWVADAPISLTNDGYADVNPFAIPPTPGTTNNIPAALFLLVRTEDMTTEVFTCPSGTAEKDTMENLQPSFRGNFTGDGKPGGSVTKHVGYSFVNVYPSNAALAKKYQVLMTAYSSDFAIAADISPMAADDPQWKQIKVGVARTTMIKGNSKNHDQDGQNVLYADGHAEFQQTPLVGTQNDNIFTAADVADTMAMGMSGDGGNDPASATDSVLLLHSP